MKRHRRDLQVKYFPLIESLQMWNKGNANSLLSSIHTQKCICDNTTQRLSFYLKCSGYSGFPRSMLSKFNFLENITFQIYINDALFLTMHST